jgi:hypothetical protein
MKMRKLLIFMAIAVLILSAFVIIDADEGAVDGAAKTNYEVGDTCTFYSGTGTTKHNPSSDTAAYGKDTRVKVTMVVDSLPKAADSGWDDYGDMRVTGFEFSAASDLVYIPSYVLYKSTVDGVSHIYLYRVVSIDDSAKKQLDDKGMEVVLPKALRDESFGSNVTVTTEGYYMDTKGNTVHYSVDETMPTYMNGFGSYANYGYSDNPDSRYCEQGTVTKVEYAEGQTTYDLKTVNWSKNPMVSCDRWVCGSFPDMIGVVVSEPAPQPSGDSSETYQYVLTGLAILITMIVGIWLIRRKG